MRSFKTLRGVALLALMLLTYSASGAQSLPPDAPVAQQEPTAVVAEVPAKSASDPGEAYVAKTFFSKERSTKEGTKLRSANKGLSLQPYKAQSDPEDWQVAFAPYLYMTGISGTVGANGRTIEVDSSFGNVLENLSFGLMGTLEVKKGRFISVTDMIWTKMGAERNTAGPLYNTARVDVNMFVFDPEVGYRVYEGDGGSFDVLGGVRLWSVENSLETTTGVLPGFNVSQRKTWVAFVGGFRGVANVTPRFFLSTKFDIGAGSGTDITTQIYAGAGFRIKPNAALIGGYRFLKVNHDDNSGFVFNTQMNGFVLGGKFNF